MTSIRLIHFMLALCTTLSSCKEVVLWRYGLHQPRKESTRSIRKFLARQKFPNKNIFVFRDSSAYLHYLREPIHRHHLFGTTLYSSAGLLDGFKDTTHTFSCLMASLRPLDKETVIDTSAADTYAVVTWAAFLGQCNKRLFSIRQTIIEQQEVKVVRVFLNIDMLEEWNLNKDQGLVFRDD